MFSMFLDEQEFTYTSSVLAKELVARGFAAPSDDAEDDPIDADSLREHLAFVVAKLDAETEAEHTPRRATATSAKTSATTRATASADPWTASLASTATEENATETTENATRRRAKSLGARPKNAERMPARSNPRT